MKVEVVDCPKCNGKMVPLSGIVQEDMSVAPKKLVVPLAEWRCVRCNYSVKR